MPLVYEELRRMAKSYMRRQASGHTFQTTELIHEAYLKIAKGEERNWENRAHFFGVASRAMRHILVDYARSKQRQKRGCWQERVTFAEGLPISNDSSEKIIALDDALKQLAVLDARKSRVVEMKFFGGLNTEEIAEVMKITLKPSHAIGNSRECGFRANWRAASKKRNLQNVGSVDILFFQLPLALASGQICQQTGGFSRNSK